MGPVDLGECARYDCERPATHATIDRNARRRNHCPEHADYWGRREGYTSVRIKVGEVG